MSQEAERHEIAKKAVVCQIPGSDAVTTRPDVKYRETDSNVLSMDIYYPAESHGGARIPVVVFVLGYSDVGVKKVLGCKAKEMASSVSWARLAAATGMAAITYSNQEPVTDIRTLLGYVRENAPALGIDENRIGLWAASGNVPMALSLLMQAPAEYLKCAVLCYGFTLDIDGSTWMSEAAEKWGFVNACEGKSVDDLAPNVPLFIARAGQDEFPHLNDAMDRFVARALARNLPVTLVNHAAGPHAFDLMHDSEVSRQIIRQILDFMRFHLLVVDGDSLKEHNGRSLSWHHLDRH